MRTGLVRLLLVVAMLCTLVPTRQAHSGKAVGAYDDPPTLVPAESLTIRSVSPEQKKLLEEFRASLAPASADYLDLKAYQTEVKDQNNRGSCPSFAFLGALEAAYVRTYGLHELNRYTDGWTRWQEYGITNDCSLICVTPECYAGCEEFDLSEEYFIHIVFTSHASYRPELMHDNWTSQCGTHTDHTLPGHALAATNGLFLPLEKYAPYFGRANVQLYKYGTYHGDADRATIVTDSGMVCDQFDDKGNATAITLTQEALDAYEFDERLIPLDARKNAEYGPTRVLILTMTEARDSSLIEDTLADQKEVYIGLNWEAAPPASQPGGANQPYLDCNTGQTYDDGNPICDFTNHTEDAVSGHALLIIGYDRTRKLLLLKNSWGPDLPYLWVPYDYIEKQAGGGAVVLGVRSPFLGQNPEAMWMGEWNMDHDGHLGRLVIRRTRPMPPTDVQAGEFSDVTANSYARLGSYYGSDGVAHEVTGKILDGAGYMIRLYIDFDNPEGAPDAYGDSVELNGQEFELELINSSNPQIHANFAAGTTTWSGHDYGALLYRTHIDIGHESASFERARWLDQYKLYFDGGSEQLFDVQDMGSLSAGGYYPVTAELGQSSGSIAAVDGEEQHHLWIWGSSADFYYHTWELGVLSGPGHFGLRIADLPYSGIWKGNVDKVDYNFYVQHYDTASTVVIYAGDPTSLYAFLADMFNSGTFQADSMDPKQQRTLKIVFSSDTQGTAVLTDNTKTPPVTVQVPITKTFPAKETLHSGIWKCADLGFNLYLQEYEVGSALAVYTYDGEDFHPFLGEFFKNVFSAPHMAHTGEQLTITVTDTDSAKAVLSSRPDLNIMISKTFEPVGME